MSALDLGEIDFSYDDSDTYPNEIAELYSYTEGPEFQQNLKAFHELMGEYGTQRQWHSLDEKKQKGVVLRLLDQIELTRKEARLKGIRAILYITQGAWGEVQSDEEQMSSTRKNVLIMYHLGVFDACVEQLKLEIENSNAAAAGVRKPAVSLADSLETRLVLSILYTFVETMRRSRPDDTDDVKKAREEFRADVGGSGGEEPFAVILLSVVTKFCSGSAPHFPMRKVLLLLWKVILFSLGGMKDLARIKNEAREAAGLQPITEDTLDVTRNMRPASPPASSTDIGETPGLIGAQRPSRRVGLLQMGLMKQSSLDETTVNGNLDGDSEISPGYEEDIQEIEERRAMEERGELPQPPSPRPSTPTPPRGKALPWIPKVRPKDINIFLETARMKFFGYRLKDDRVSLIGLPLPLHEGVSVLKQHVYVSLAEKQMEREECINDNPVSCAEEDIPQIPSEILYQAMLPSLPQSMIALLKILLAASPTSKTKTESINIMADVLPEEMPIAILDFPSCVLGLGTGAGDLTEESLNIGETGSICWRNMFSCVNLLRVLNKLTKWKHSRIMMLVVFKSAPILKRALKVRHALLQLYALKLLKMQTKYLGRQWRKSNMKTLSAIYQKVRHRLNDDWAYGNDLDARPWDFQAEECSLRANVDRFNSRRYGNRGGTEGGEFEPMDNWVISALGKHIELTDEFKQHYEIWLQQEVFTNSIDWDQLVDQRLLW
ncbi:unnamed protein product [Darwinula stevensoni]|uniref:Striatin-interacting protein 1 n=1 Tax=Darwinula stevensoni TaxID=69355 RepID=A0A7R8XET1_9CRUS|nr:unnamed protein product [Darwinula stevensoni]CAG0895605.1 unnamed protein product [Darwinula stevensoni]